MNPEEEARTYDSPNGKSKIGLPCPRSTEIDCVPAEFLTAQKRTFFHNKALAEATKKINRVLKKVAKGNHNRRRHLSVIIINNRPLLVWAQHVRARARSKASDKETIISEALGLKAAASSRQRSAHPGKK